MCISDKYIREKNFESFNFSKVVYNQWTPRWEWKFYPFKSRSRHREKYSREKLFSWILFFFFLNIESLPRNTCSNLPIPKLETDLHKNDYFSNLVSTRSILYRFRILIERKENFKIKSAKWSLIVENDSNSQVFAYWINPCKTI